MASKFEDLKELQAMLDRGEITQAEYDIVKADLLASEEPEDIQPVGRHADEVKASEEEAALRVPLGRGFTAGSSLIAATIAAAAIALGSLLPWVSVSSIFGSISISGTQGDGVITLFAGVLLAVVTGTALAKKTVSLLTAVLVWLLGAGAGLISFNVFTNLLESADIGGSTVLSSIGGGLWLVLIGSAAAVGSGFPIFANRTDRPLDSPPQESNAGVWAGVAVAVVFLVALVALGNQMAQSNADIIKRTFEEVASGLDQ